MRVLIVDDSKAMRIIVARALREMGVPGSSFLEAANGKEALGIIAAQDPDLVISDLNMPEMSGMELLQSIRNSGNDAPFGFVTSEASDRLLQDALTAGARFVLSKPFTPVNLGKTLSPVLSDLGCGTVSVEADSGTAAGGAVNAFPTAVQAGATLRDLLRRGVTAKRSAPVLRPKEDWFVAEYQWVDKGSAAAYVTFDLPFAANAGAALTLMPLSLARESIRARVLESTIADNCREVLNIMARFFDNGGWSRVRLDRIYRPGENVGPEIAGGMLKPTARLDLAVDIGGYGPGFLSLLSLAEPLAAK